MARSWSGVLFHGPATHALHPPLRNPRPPCRGHDSTTTSPPLLFLCSFPTKILMSCPCSSHCSSVPFKPYTRSLISPSPFPLFAAAAVMSCAAYVPLKLPTTELERWTLRATLHPFCVHPMSNICCQNNCISKDSFSCHQRML